LVSGIAIRLSRIATKELILDAFQATQGDPHRRHHRECARGFIKAGHHWKPHFFGKRNSWIRRGVLHLLRQAA
jgi:hypothetical protein